MSAGDRELSAYERWMVRSNLETIRATGVTAAEQAAILRANGYERIAAAVEQAAGGERKLYAVVLASPLDFEEFVDDLARRGLEPLFLTNPLAHEDRDVEHPDFDISVRSHDRELEGEPSE